MSRKERSGASAEDPRFQITGRYTFVTQHPAGKRGSDGDAASPRGNKPLPARHLESGWNRKHSPHMDGGAN